MYHNIFFFFFFNDTATTEIYTLSLHDALPICAARGDRRLCAQPRARLDRGRKQSFGRLCRSEEHTSELQSPCNLVCRLLLEKKKKINISNTHNTSSHSQQLRYIVYITQ